MSSSSRARIAMSSSAPAMIPVSTFMATTLLWRAVASLRGSPMTQLRQLDRSLCETAGLLNLGAGTGRWLLQEARRLGVEHPLGVDLNQSKVARAQASGLPVYQADFTHLDPLAFPAVKVVVFDNVLE